MAIYGRNETLMCKLFPSSLDPMAMKWFDRLRERSIDSYEELTRAFGARFITCNRVSRTLDSLLALLMREGETLKTYSDRYWELYNKLDRDFEDMVVRTFKSGLPTKFDLWESLTMKPARNMRQLMDWIDEHKRVEDDRTQIKGKTKGFHDRKDNRFNKTRGNWPKVNFHGQGQSSEVQLVNSVFRVPVHQILQKICNEPYFTWLHKMGGDPTRRN